MLLVFHKPSFWGPPAVRFREGRFHETILRARIPRDSVKYSYAPREGPFQVVESFATTWIRFRISVQTLIDLIEKPLV